MATADELLAALTNSDEDEKVLVIDNDLRTITIPKSIKALGVESDDEVHRLYFQMPRMCGDVDLSTFNIRINYMNAKREGDIYVVTDKKILSDSITFSWLVGRNALAYKGNVNFIVCLKESNASGDVLREFNTTVASLPVLEGLEVDPAYLEGELHDVLEQLLSLTVAKVAEVEAAGASQIAKVQQESTKQQTNITEHGAQVLATIPADYQTTTKLADEGVRSKADAITRTVEGKRIEVKDASDDNLRGLKLFGKTTQQTYTGKNLYKQVGSRITANADGTYTIDATNDVRAGIANTLTGKIPAGTYTFSYLQGYSQAYIEFAADVHAFILNVGDTKTFEYDGNSYLRILSSNVPAGKVATYKVQLELGSKATEWEPYTGGIPAPNPDYPQPLVSPGDSGAIHTTVCGKNLVDIFNENMNVMRDGRTGTAYPNIVNVDGSLTINVSGTVSYGQGFVKSLCAGQTVTISYTIDAVGNGSGLSFRIYDINNYTNSLIWKASANTEKVTCTFTPTVDSTYMFGWYVGSGTYPCGAKIHDLQLEFGEVATAYEPYKPMQTLTASTPNGLPGIPVESGGNHVDENGQQWICDEVDFERGVYVQRIKTTSMPTTHWFTSGVTVQHYGTSDYALDSYVDTYGIQRGLGAFCTHLPYKFDESGILGGTETGISMLCTPSTNAYRIAVYAPDITLDNWLAFLEENEVTLSYPLATPISTPLSAADLASFKAAKTAKPFTQIFNDSDVEMEASYNADTEIYIDNKIAERTPRNSYVAPAIVETKSGEVISVSDSSDDTVRGLKLFGKTTQFTTTGKNLFDDIAWFEQRGLTKQSDGSWYYDGTRGTNMTCWTNAEKRSGTVYLTAIFKTEVSTNPLYFIAYYTDGTDLYSNSFSKPTDYAEITLKTDPNKTVDYIKWTYGNGGAYNIKSVTISFVDGEYEPYTGGKAAPNPDYPQELESVGESGAINTKVLGKNLLAWPYYRNENSGNPYTINGVTFTTNENGSITFTGTNTGTSAQDAEYVMVHKSTKIWLPAGTYVLNTGVPYDASNPWYLMAAQYEGVTDENVYAYGGKKQVVFTKPGYLYVVLRAFAGKKIDNVTIYPQLEIGTVETEYSKPVQSQTLTASTPNGLPGIPVDSGGNYTDSDGQQWICDEIDFARGVRVHRLHEVDMGTLNWTYQSGHGVLTSSVLSRKPKIHASGLCTHYLVVKKNFRIILDGEIVVREPGWSSNPILVVKDLSYTDGAAFKVAMAGAKVVHELEEPIETPLTKAELAAYRAAALHTNYPGTTIYNDANAGQEVTYVADTKNWIKNQLGV